MTIPIKKCPLQGGWTIENGELIAPYHHPHKTQGKPETKSNPSPVVKTEAQKDATPEPTPSPTPDATPEPTPSPTPDATPEPTPSPAPDATPELTPSPAPVKTPAAKPTQTPKQPQTPRPVMNSPVKSQSSKTSAPSENLRQNLKNSRDVFDKNRKKEEIFLEQIKKDDDFQRQ
jgi:outer membrane biosynthesis protein TonB